MTTDQEYELRLLQIKARLDAALSSSFEEWSADTDDHIDIGIYSAWAQVRIHDVHYEQFDEADHLSINEKTLKLAEDDAEFIRHAPADVQWLLDEVQRLNNLVAEQRAYLNTRGIFQTRR